MQPTECSCASICRDLRLRGALVLRAMALTSSKFDRSLKGIGGQVDDALRNR